MFSATTSIWIYINESLPLLSFFFNNTKSSLQNTYIHQHQNQTQPSVFKEPHARENMAAEDYNSRERDIVREGLRVAMPCLPTMAAQDALSQEVNRLVDEGAPVRYICEEMDCHVSHYNGRPGAQMGGQGGGRGGFPSNDEYNLHNLSNGESC